MTSYTLYTSIAYTNHRELLSLAYYAQIFTCYAFGVQKCCLLYNFNYFNGYISLYGLTLPVLCFIAVLSLLTYSYYAQYYAYEKLVLHFVPS